MYLDKLKSNFPIKWGTVWLGWVGFNNYSKLLTYEDIASYCSDYLDSNEVIEDEVISLISTSDSEEITQLLNELVSKENSDLENEKRKWLVILLEKLLADIAKDPLYGIMELTDFWKKWNNPPKNPMSEFYKDNDTPQTLYTENRFENVKKKTFDWIVKEKKKLSNIN